jgi:hypothetical protein
MKKRAVTKKEFEWLIEAIADRARKYPSEAFNALFQAMDKIERKHGLLYRLTKSEQIAIAESLREDQVANAKEVEPSGTSGGLQGQRE